MNARDSSFETDTRKRTFLFALAALAWLLGVGALFVSWGNVFVWPFVGVGVGAVAASIFLGLHNQAATRRTLVLGEFLPVSMLWARRLLVPLIVLTAAANGYRFAIELERWALR